jgi:26S proteasome regulatory subunit N1
LLDFVLAICTKPSTMAGKPDAGAADKPSDKKDAKKPVEEKDEDLSDEDLQLKKNLELLVERLHDPSADVQKVALDNITNEIRTSTSSMTSVPKPLKFLRPHYDVLVKRFEQLPAGEIKAHLADVISVLATTVTAKEEKRSALKYKLVGTVTDLGSWGHEYLRHVAGEISEEYKQRQDDEEDTDDLLKLVEQIVPYHMTHFAEPEAVDLLLEVDQLPILPQYVDEKNYARTCLYLISCCNYLPEPDDTTVLTLSHEIYLKQHKYHDALRVAMMLNDRDVIEKTFVQCTDELEKKQLCYLLARQGEALNLEEGACAVEDEPLREALREIISNSKLSEHFLALARDLDVMEPKTAEDVYKTHLVDGRAPSGAAAVDSARQNLATTFVNGFVNAAFGQDKLVTAASEGAADPASTHWIFKNKDHGKTSATASLGLITLWDVEGGLPQIDKYLYYPDPYVVSGALLAIGMVNCCVQVGDVPRPPASAAAAPAGRC